MVSSFAQLLREARKGAEVSQKELADQVGVDHSYISKIERGIYGPPVRDKVLAIADALEITGNASRAYFLLAAGCANVDDLEGLADDDHLEERDDISVPFGAGALHFPRTDQLEKENTIEQLRQLLNSPGLSREQRAELYELLRSFLAWLKFRVGDTRERRTDK